jgi:thiamine-monophosphate kinase
MPQAPQTPSRRRFGAGGPSLAQVGERALLERLVAISREACPSASAGGDDAAVWSPPPGRDLAVSVDALVEDVDFRRSWIDPHRLGGRAFGVAVSDLAGMGAEPVNCVATLCVRATEQVEDVLEIQRGLCEAAASVGCAVVGGDVSAIDGPLVIDVCVTGSLPEGRALRRAAGRPGEVLVVTGVLGRSAAGLQLLLDKATPASDVEGGWIGAHLDPVVRLREGMQLLQAGVRCAGDVSDGILVDVARTAAASGCGAEIWADHVPVDEHLRERFSHRWLELAIGGGEDFELVAAIAEDELDGLVRAWPGNLAPLTVIGALTEGSGLRLLERRGGPERTPPASLAEHFS